MGALSKIQWTTHTWNPWWGCAKVSPGCKNCYAEAFAKRVGQKVWGVDGPRRFFGEKHWNEPLKWARAAAKAGERHRVFCASMADVFEARDDLEPERQKLWKLIRETVLPCTCTHRGHAGWCAAFVPAYNSPDWKDRLAGRPGLDWLLLTKRPENIIALAPPDILPLVWVGTTVEDQEHADLRIPELLHVPARVRFLSCEPLLGPVNLRLNPQMTCTCMGRCNGRAGLGERWGCALDEGKKIDWVIVGGESGPRARPFDLAWARSIRDQCAAAGVACFVKQLGAAASDEVNGLAGASLKVHPDAAALISKRLKDRAGGDPSEWPADLRVRQFPEVA